MNRTTDIVVIGSGLAGLMAACAAVSKNCSVRVISRGMGSLAISPGCIDVLGYDNKGKRLADPWSGFANLPPAHPYSLLGGDKVKAGLDAMVSLLEKGGVRMKAAADASGNARNIQAPTIMGTLKPTCMVQDEPALFDLGKANRILVVGVKGFRDCRPRFIASQLRRYPDLAEKDFGSLVLPAPFKEHARSINALDLAHVADREEGRLWLLDELRDRGKGFDIALLPPMLGARADSPIRGILEKVLGCPFIEMLSVPPGVGGLRIRHALVNHLHDRNAEFFENSQVLTTEVVDGICQSLTAEAAGRHFVHRAKAIVVATGGILSGGIELSAGAAKESIFNLEIPVPENVDEWSEPEISGKHMVTGLGVKVDSNLRAVGADGSLAIKNVFFAGRTLGGYDYAIEKSGHGVAAATGWQAGLEAAAYAAQDNKATGADI